VRAVVVAFAALAAVSVRADAQARSWPSPAAGPTMTGDPELIFTFDDGPNPKTTPAVLDTLAKHHIKAVFFMIGEQMKKKDTREIIQRIEREGHIIANHTMKHLDLCSLKDDVEAAAEIDDGKAAIEAVAGIRVLWFRVPYGARCQRVDALLAQRGITHFHWDIDPQEWRDGNAKKAFDYVTKQLGRMKGRNVLLMHDIKKATVASLPQILDWLEAENVRRKVLRIRRIRIIQAPELALERMPPGLADWMIAIAPTRTGLAHAVASVLP
jgi:peptidoglycan/xylan/chitin deacetylase (PgdA/CDA1 family)